MVITRINSGASIVADKINSSLSVITRTINSATSQLFERINSGLSELDFEPILQPFINRKNIVLNTHGILRDDFTNTTQKARLNYIIFGD